MTYAVTSLSRFYVAPREGHLQLAKKVFGYLEKYPKRGYATNPQPLTIKMEYEKVELKIDFGSQYSYFQEDIDDRSPEPIFDQLYLSIFLDEDHGHDNVMVISIAGILSVVGSTPTACS